MYGSDIVVNKNRSVKRVNNHHIQLLKLKLKLKCVLTNYNITFFVQYLMIDVSIKYTTSSKGR
jgi:hypothetical protein